ncbi:MAG: glycosyltransferase family 39 protein [Bryobacteraceae bacterium]|jgi:4-amino-4-deoxy-L-arabinose transferase-like glycosyltransferase
MKRLRAALTSLLVILAVALCLRLGYGWEYQQHRSHKALGVIPFLFEPGNIAASVVTGKGFSSPFRVETGPTAWLTPVYPLLLAGIFRVFGLYTFQSFVAAAVLNILFSTLTCVPIYYAGRRIGGRGVAAGAAWLWAVFLNAIRLPVESMWDASLASLLAAAILWATLALVESCRVSDWCAYGLLWGLALMTNPTLLSLLPFLLGWLAYRSRRYGHVALAAGMAVLCCAPWTARNFVVFHRFIPLRSVVGLTLWLGNHDQSAGAWVGRLHPITNTAERAKYIELGEIAYMQDKRREAVRFMMEHPGDELRACWFRFVVIWTGGSAHPLAEFGGVLLFNVLASIGALAGIVVLFRARSACAFPLAVFPLVFPCAYYLTLASARYRHPMDPALLLLTAVAVGSVIAKARAGSLASRQRMSWAITQGDAFGRGRSRQRER